jgi:hypothetical protein
MDNKALRNAAKNTPIGRLASTIDAVAGEKFDLSMKGAANDLKLQLRVETPVNKMAKYSDEIFCFIQPRDVYK